MIQREIALEAWSMTRRRPAEIDPSDEPAAPFGSVGSDLRALRRARGVSLAALALGIGRSVGFLSQVERGLSQPSIADLRRIAAFFETSIGFFFGATPTDPRESGVVVRAGARRRLGDPDAGLVEELLSPGLGGSFEVVLSTFSPGAALEAPSRRDTEETGYVVSGVLDLDIDGEAFRLAAGDSFHIDRRPFRWRNPEAAPCVVVWVIAPPTY